MNYTKKMNWLVNEIYKTVKPYTQRLDEGQKLDDTMAKSMIEDAENFTTNHVAFSGSGFYPLPSYHDRTEIDRITFTIILNMMYLVSKWTEIDGRAKKPDTSEQISVKKPLNPSMD